MKKSGEGVGFSEGSETRCSSVAALRPDLYRGRRKLDMEYEDALTNFFQDIRVGYEKIGGLPWIEIDFPEDITRAASQILPAIETLENTPSTVPVT